MKNDRMKDDGVLNNDPAVQARWRRVPDWARQKILGSVWCAHCRAGTVMNLAGGRMEGISLILTGFCAKCGQKVVRVIEEDDSATS